MFSRIASSLKGMGFTASRFRTLHSQPDTLVETPQHALRLLREGNARFVKGNFLAPDRNLQRLKMAGNGPKTQKPFAAFLACADSRVPVEIIYDQGFGDIFISRIAGNICTNEITASLEFGCAVLGCKVLYILGHTSCGAVAATMAGAPVPGVISSLYYHIRPACDHANGDVEKAVEENVKLQAKQLQVSPVLNELIKEGKLIIVKGVYNLQTGEVKELH